MSSVATEGRPRRALGWILALVSLLTVATVPLSLSGEVASRPGVQLSQSATFPLDVAIVAGFAVAGGFLIHWRVANPLGWLMVGTALANAVSFAATAFAARALTDPDRSLPFGLFAASLGSTLAVPALLCPVLLLPALYPSGAPPSRFWVRYLQISAVGVALLTLAVATSNDVANDPVVGMRLPWQAPPWWTWATAGTSAVVLVPALGVVLVGTLIRIARARTPERQQLLWLVCVIAAMVAVVALPHTEVPLAVAFAFVPIAVVIGVTRYHLLGIEVALQRTLLYAPLTAFVAVTIGAFTAGLASLLPTGPMALLAASAAVATLVIPAARRLRVWADRLVLGERADPLALMDHIGIELERSTGDPVAAMLEAVATAVGAPYAAVRDSRGSVRAARGCPSTEKLTVPLVHAGANLGEVEVGARRGAARVTARDARLVRALAPHVAVVVSAARLVHDLEQQRERVMRATLTERDRLRRDLHDGLGPSLSGIALGLEAADVALHRDPGAVSELLHRTRCEADTAVREIRRVLAGLRPTSLDRSSLADAVRDVADQLDTGIVGRPRFALHIASLPALAPDVEESVFRIAAEAMTNAARHSSARHCEVRIDREGEQLTLSVRDDGHGLPARPVTGHGLDSMRCRASSLGGHLTVASADPQGTAVTAVLPLKVVP